MARLMTVWELLDFKETDKFFRIWLCYAVYACDRYWGITVVPN